MTSLPEKKSCLDGLKQRQFRPSAAPQQDLSWTHTPEQKLQALKDGPAEVSLEEEARMAALKVRDSEMEKLAKKAKKSKKRDEKSLLELHQKELKKKKKKEKKEREGKKEERRPFNRDIDLQANRLDDAQKKAIYKKAQLLDTRFSFGESKFL